jgi:hypothetical protein
MSKPLPTRADQSWEWRWAPYDEPTYQAVLDQIRPDDRVLEIGAGDLRLARRLAQHAQQVYAIEIQLPLLRLGTPKRPNNLQVIRGDAQKVDFPEGITVGVLLMRHCTHLRLYWRKLKAAGASRLITNARWRMGVETIDLTAPRMPFREVKLGWYTCWCGGVGFVPGLPALVTSSVLEKMHEVTNCPHCS